MNIASLLLIAIFLPLGGACAISLTSGWGKQLARWIALVTTLATLVVACLLVIAFGSDGQYDQTIGITEISWIHAAGIDIRFSVGLDGLGLWLFALSSLLMPTAVLVSWRSITDRPGLFYGMLLALETGCLGVFVARDLMLFYVFFEFTLIPLFFLIGIWGSEQRQYAAMKFFLFTLAGSVLTFLGFLAIVVLNGRGADGFFTFSIPELTQSLSQQPRLIAPELQFWIFLALFAGFAIKVPLFPLHTWLPLAHVQAPTAGSVFLAGVLLKIGTYGFLRFSLPMLPDATALFMPWILWLAVLGILYGALVALAQSDIKRLIAYSSVSHMGFCMLGIFSLNELGMQGGLLQMVNHGISTGALFALVGMLYERYHTRQIADLGGLSRRLPWLAAFMLLFTLSSIGLPGTNGFASEFLLLLGMFQRAWVQADGVWALHLKAISVLALLGVVLGAWYMLWLMQRIFFGPLKEPQPADDNTANHAPVSDMSWREVLALAPLALMVFWIGLAPKFFLDRMAPTLDHIATSIQQPVEQMLQQQPATKVVTQPAVTSQPISEEMVRAR